MYDITSKSEKEDNRKMRKTHPMAQVNFLWTKLWTMDFVQRAPVTGHIKKFMSRVQRVHALRGRQQKGTRHGSLGRHYWGKREGRNGLGK